MCDVQEGGRLQLPLPVTVTVTTTSACMCVCVRVLACLCNLQNCFAETKLMLCTPPPFSSYLLHCNDTLKKKLDSSDPHQY